MNEDDYIGRHRNEQIAQTRFTSYGVPVIPGHTQPTPEPLILDVRPVEGPNWYSFTGDYSVIG
jgi:hypothetical protein